MLEPCRMAVEIYADLYAIERQRRHCKGIVVVYCHVHIARHISGGFHVVIVCAAQGFKIRTDRGIQQLNGHRRFHTVLFLVQENNETFVCCHIPLSVFDEELESRFGGISRNNFHIEPVGH